MIVLLYTLFAILCGWLEAILYSRRAAESFTMNEHGGMMLQRIVVALLPLAGAAVALVTGTWVHVAFELIPTALLFPMCHDEAYNFTRLWITWSAPSNGPVNIVTDRWAFRMALRQYQYGYQSPTTTARFDFDGPRRTGLAAAGLIIWVIGYLIIL